MADEAARSFSVEKKEQAVILQPLMKMLDEDQLKMLTDLVENAAGPDSGIKLVILDLSRISILPSLALGLMVQISKNCVARDQKLKLTGLQPQIRRVFSVTRLDRTFQFADSTAAAMA
jgi:anti-sigma B factor antagonist